LGQYAGFVTRLIAWITDQIIIGATVGIIIAGISFFFQSLPKFVWLGSDEAVLSIGVVVGVAIAITVPPVYFIGSWMLAGQTVGKWVMGVRIIRTDGERLRFSNCVLRLIGYVVSAILLLGFLWILVDNRRQGFHDKIARTFVVYSWPELEPVHPLLQRARGLVVQRRVAQSQD
jgi:uncharacterized RDD family membrane protein YckC